MADDQPIQLFRGGNGPAPRDTDAGDSGEQVMFDRRELNTILDMYGRKVAQGEWRDYAIGAGRNSAVFAIFRHSAEAPLYRVEKRPDLRNRQGMYSVIAMTGQILKRGHDLAQVLRVLDPRRPQLVD
ncbi:MAG: DUF2794 domain-containing protein [Alphaproteobacteria bacterium]|nr:DUF2794 domain-containing protein [Alphaproteobacteria bacterium]